MHIGECSQLHNKTEQKAISLSLLVQTVFHYQKS